MLSNYFFSHALPIQTSVGGSAWRTRTHLCRLERYPVARDLFVVSTQHGRVFNNLRKRSSYTMPNLEQPFDQRIFLSGSNFVRLGTFVLNVPSRWVKKTTWRFAPSIFPKQNDTHYH